MGEQEQDVEAVASVLAAARTESGKMLVELTECSPVLLVFLRHSGCTFCREALSDIAKARKSIEARGIRIVLVHMSDQEAIHPVISRYGLGDLERIADSGQALYTAFGLKRGNIAQLFGLKVWWRGLVAGVWDGHGWGQPTADYRQMPGVFFVDQGMVVRGFRHRSAADRPPYDGICSR